MATRQFKNPPKIHPAFDVKPEPEPPPVPQSAGEYGPYRVRFTVDGVGRKTIVWCGQNPALVGTMMP